jgi:hypothetical protein
VPGVFYYRVVVTDLSNGCADPISNVLQITIEPQPTVDITVDNPLVCIGGSSVITSVVTDGSGVFTTSGSLALMLRIGQM